MTIIRSVILFIVLVLISIGVIFAGGQKKDKVGGLAKTQTNDFYSTFLINNTFNYYSNNGDASFNIYIPGGASAFEFPKGSGHTAIFEDGLVWGCQQAGTVKVGGSSYRHGLQAGRMLNSTTADDPGLAKNRVYRVRPDITPTTDNFEALTLLEAQEVPYISRFESGRSASTILQQYIDDWNEWPASEGAPFDDVDHNGVYDPTIDIPGIPGADQTLWHVSNDLNSSRTTYLHGSDPIGLEMQRTIWGYNRTGALGNTIFIKYKVINKSGVQLDSMFFSQWADPDLGGAQDDFTGCDTTRSLGFVYNGAPRDEQYADHPPAVGFDFFQGPIVPGSPTDTAIFDLKYKVGYKNLGMTAFNYFINGDPTYADPALGVIDGTNEWYNLMKGLVGLTGSPYVDPTTGLTTKFVLAGDPVTNTGWIDRTPGDRRMCLITGPFTMVVDDTQEVVVAALCAPGSDRLTSVSVLRFYDDLAQKAYNLLFDLPQPPPAPSVNVFTASEQLVLDWSNPVKWQTTENWVSKGYKFQGYNVYQCPGPDFSDAKLLATYDIIDSVYKIFDPVFDEQTGVIISKPVQFGNESGIFHYFETKTDAFTGAHLVNGKNYFYAVTAYAYNPNELVKALESAPRVFEVVIQQPKPGYNPNSAYDQVIDLLSPSVHTAGRANMSPVVTVINPDSLTGHVYSISFDSVVVGASTVMRWTWRDTTKGVTLYQSTNLSSKMSGNISDDYNWPVLDGLRVQVNEFPATQTQLSRAATVWESNSPDWLTSGGRFVSDPNQDPASAGFVGGGYAAVTTGASLGGLYLGQFGSSFPDANLYPVEVRFDTAVTQLAYRLRRTGAATEYLIQSTSPTAALPFTAWDMSNPASPRQLTLAWRDQVNDAQWTPDVEYDNLEVIFILDQTYDPTMSTQFAMPPSAIPNEVTTSDVLYGLSLGLVSGHVINESKGTLKIVPILHLNSNDRFVFTTPKTSYSVAKAKDDVKKINVFPNPYFGFSNLEFSKYNRFITFSHLPAKATIRIFTLAGILVRTIIKDDPAQFVQWDMKNASGLPIGAGMFIAYVDMPDIGTTKVLKFAIIPESQILDKY